MANLSQAKILGGIGAILAVLIVIPTAGWILALIGLILMLIAVKYISDAVADRSIFNNIIIYVVTAIIGVIIGGVFIIAAALSIVDLGGINPGMYSTPGVLPANIWAIVTTVLIGLVVVWVMFIISAIFLRKSFGSIATKTGVGMFRTAALIYLIGAILTIVAIGLILIWIAWILFIVAFFTLPDNTTASPTPQPAMPSNTPPPPPTPAPSTTS